MSELEKKAKTLEQVEKEYLEFKYQKRGIISRREQMDKFNKIKWVRLKDAQKEIDRLNYLLLKYNQEAMDYEQKVESERLELKQNLEEWFMELGGWLMSSEVRGKLRGWNKLDLPKEMKEKFEELLKEAEKP